MSGEPCDGGASAADGAHANRRLAPLGRMLGDSLGELNLLRFLPELASHLRAIRQSTEVMPPRYAECTPPCAAWRARFEA